MEKRTKYLEIYKCTILTLIAILLFGSWFKTLPVRVAGGSVWIDGGRVDVDNTVRVDVTNTVDVAGTVSIQR